MIKEASHESLYIDSTDLEGEPVNHVLFLSRLLTFELSKKINFFQFQKQNEIISEFINNVCL